MILTPFVGALSDRLGRRAGLGLVFAFQLAAYLLAGSQPASWALRPIQVRIFKVTAASAFVLTGLAAIYGNAYGVKPYSYGIYRLGPDLEAALAPLAAAAP